MGFGIPRAVWKNVNIHHGTIDLKGTAAWASGLAANISIEANRTWPIENCEIHHCNLNSNVSFPGGKDALRTGKKTLRFHNNKMPLVEIPGGPGNYALEMSLDDCEIDHNVIEGGSWFLAGIYEKRVNYSIHHNIIRNQIRSWEWTIIAGEVTNLQIYNNIFHWDKGEPDWSIVGLKNNINGLLIQNNVIEVSDEVKKRTNRTVALIDNATWGDPRPMFKIENLVVRNNIYSNSSLNMNQWPGTWDQNLNAKADWKREGQVEEWYTSKSASGNLVNAGSSLGIENPVFSNKAPDIGVYEFNSSTIRILSLQKKGLVQGKKTLHYSILGRNIKDNPSGYSMSKTYYQ